MESIAKMTINILWFIFSPIDKYLLSHYLLLVNNADFVCPADSGHQSNHDKRTITKVLELISTYKYIFPYKIIWHNLHLIKRIWSDLIYYGLLDYFPQRIGHFEMLDELLYDGVDVPLNGKITFWCLSFKAFRMVKVYTEVTRLRLPVTDARRVAIHVDFTCTWNVFVVFCKICKKYCL